ncbi:MAG TPA: N-acetylglucosamine-6-phosphate deacetylase, partial [Phycisphaerales bacterium]|nr:N-acetylglucosamine-6-phosphate deacetylase [Phycisphaerales bacterium]
LQDKKGTIAVGKDADLILFDDNLSVHTTIVGGKIVFRK